MFVIYPHAYKFFALAGKLSAQSKLHVPSALHQPQDEGNLGRLAHPSAGQVWSATRNILSDGLNYWQVPRGKAHICTLATQSNSSLALSHLSVWTFLPVSLFHPSLPPPFLSLSLLPHSSLLYPGQTHFYLSSSPPLSPCSLFNITLHTLLLAPPNIHFQVHVTTKDKLQLTGVTAMLIASKYEEIYYPQVADFSYITDHTYSEDDIRRMEQFMLQTIGYRLGSPAPIHFLRRFSKLNQVSHKTKVAQA